MFTFILITISALAALWLLLHLLSWWLMPAGYKSAAAIQIEAMESTFDALDRQFAREKRLRRKEEREAAKAEALARGEIFSPQPRQKRPKQASPSASAPIHPRKPTPFERFRQKLEAEFAQEQTARLSSPSQPDASARAEVQSDVAIASSLPPPAAHRKPLSTLRRILLFLTRPLRRLFNALFHRAA